MIERQNDNNELQIREAQEGTGSTVYGYAIVWDSASKLIREGGRKFTEFFSKGSVDPVGKDIRLLAHHDSKQVLARTKSGTLRVWADDKGIAFEADLPDTTTGRDMKELLKRGDISSMSFGFTPEDEQWSDNYSKKIVRKADMYEISLVGVPAYSATSANIRGDEAAEGNSTMSDSIKNDNIDSTDNTVKYQRKIEVVEKTRDFDLSNNSVRDFEDYLRGSTRALTTTSSNVPLPTDLERYVHMRLYQENVIRTLSKPMIIDSNRNIAVESTLPTAALVTEGGGFSASDAAFATQIAVNAYKFGVRTTYSREYMDSVIGNGGIGTAAEYVAGRQAESLAQILDQYYTTGTGTSEPEGCMGSSASTKITAASQVVDLGTAAYTTITAANLLSLYFKLKPQYRKNGTFVMNDAVVAHIRGLTDSNGLNLWIDNTTGSLRDGVLGYLFGRPVVTATNALTATANGNIFVLFADMPKYFGIWDRAGMDSLVDPYSGAANGNINGYLWMRTDSRILLAEAAAAITC